MGRPSELCWKTAKGPGLPLWWNMMPPEIGRMT